VRFHKWPHAQSKGTMRVLVRRKDAKAEQGALRVMVPCLERDELELIRKLGVSGTRSSHRRRHGVSLLAALFDACVVLATHSRERE
jgi:hypothetical protein